MCSSSGESVVSIRHLVYVNLYKGPSSMQTWSSIQACILDGHLYRVIYTRCRIDTVDSSNDEHIAARP